MTHALNIMTTFWLATPDEIRQGASWYDDAHALALELSPGDPWRGAGVISSFSPLTPWPRNVFLARALFENGGILDGGTLSGSIRNASRIYNGEHTLDVLKGDKTRAFASAIADPHNSTIATIDRHAFDIAMGAIHTDDTRKIGKRVFRELSDAYVTAANWAGYSVAQMQAITWVTHRRIKGVNANGVLVGTV
jgi:beta-galactosidase GanA